MRKFQSSQPPHPLSHKQTNKVNFPLDSRVFCNFVFYFTSDILIFLLDFQDLKIFLSDCGQNILNEYSSTGSLVDRSRKSLIQLIVERLTTTCGFYPSREEKVVWAKAAAAIFPNLCEGKNAENFVSLSYIHDYHMRLYIYVFHQKIFYDPENRGGYISYRLKPLTESSGILRG